jgi:hypothetical protein
MDKSIKYAYATLSIVIGLLLLLYVVLLVMGIVHPTELELLFVIPLGGLVGLIFVIIGICGFVVTLKNRDSSSVFN